MLKYTLTMTEYTNIDKFIYTTHDTLNALLEYKNWADALALYFRYIQQQKMQDNVVTKSNDVFMIQAMKTWTKERFYIAKKILVDRWMIEVVKKECRYVKVNYIINQDSGNTDCWDNGLNKEESGNQESGNQESGNPATNTLVEKENTLVEKINTFDIFWEVYPNKKSKDIAKKLFDKRIKSWIDPNIIIAWAKRYKLETLWKDKHYIKHPTTRLNAWAREDEQTIDIEVLKKLYQQEVAKDKENKKAIWDKFISEYWSDTMQQVLDKINTSSFISSLL